MPRFLAIPLALLVLAGPLAADPPARAPAGRPEPPVNEHLQQLAFLVGTWIGEGEVAGAGKFTDQYTFEWALDRNFLKHDYVMKVKGQVVWRDIGYLGWDADQKKIVGFTLGMDGSIGRSSAVKPRTEEEMLVLEGTTAGNTPMKAWRTSFLRGDDLSMTSIVEVRRGTKYEPVLTIRYKRLAVPK